MAINLFSTLFNWLVPDPLVSLLVRLILPDHEFMLTNDQREEREAINLSALRDYSHTLEIAPNDTRHYLTIPNTRHARHLISVHGNLSFAASILHGQFKQTHHVHSMDYLYTELNQRAEHVFSDQTVAQHVQDIKKFIKHLHDHQKIPYHQMDIAAHSLGSLIALWAIYELIQETPVSEDEEQDHPSEITPVCFGGFGYLSTNIHPFLSHTILREKFIAAGLLPPVDMLTMARAIPNLLVISINGDQIVPDVLSLRQDIELRDHENTLFNSTLRVHAPFDLTIATDAHNCPITSTELPGMDSAISTLLYAIFYNDSPYFIQTIEAHERALSASFASLEEPVQAQLTDLTPIQIFSVITPSFIKEHANDAVHLRHIRDTSYSLIKLIAIGKKYFPEAISQDISATHADFQFHSKNHSLIHYACYFLLPIAMLGGLIGYLPGSLFSVTFKLLSQVSKWIGLGKSLSPAFDEIANTGLWFLQALGIGCVTLVILSPLLIGILGTIACEAILIGSAFGVSALSTLHHLVQYACGILSKKDTTGISKTISMAPSSEPVPLPHVAPPPIVETSTVPALGTIHSPRALALSLNRT